MSDDGAVIDPPASADVGPVGVAARGGAPRRRLGSRYVLHERIGRGAMGEVWRGAVVDSGEVVAVKLLRDELAQDPEVVSRFVRERTVLTRISHPHLISVRDLIADGDDLGIVMEMVEGGDLRRHLRAHGTLPPAEAVDLTVQILEGLDAVHAAGVVHRDLKPENVLLDSHGGVPWVRLTDFGIARVTTGQSMTRVTGLIGTPEYMAPEVVDREHATTSADLYASGVVLYELLAGRTPFSGGHPVVVLRRHLEDQPLRPPGLPDALWSVVARLLAKHPEERPSSARDAAQMLMRVRPALAGLPALPPIGPLSAESLTTSPRGASPDEGHQSTRVLTPHLDERPTLVLPGRVRAADGRSESSRRWKLVAAGVAMLAVLGAVAGGVLLTQRSSTQPPPSPSPQPFSVETFRFAPQTLSRALSVVRTWSTGIGVLHETLTVSNITPSPVDGSVDEVIPKSISASTSGLTFRPQPEILQADPVVRWSVHGLAAGAALILRYDAPTTGLAGQDRLAAWAQDLADAQQQWQSLHPAQPSATLQTLAIAPATLSMTVGQTQLLTVAGTMSDGTPAPPPLLAGLAWSSGSDTVATVVGGTVTAVGPGTATLDARVGTVDGKVPVAVAPAGQTPPPLPTPIVVRPVTPTPTPRVLPTATARPTAAPTGAPTAAPTAKPTAAPTAAPTAPPAPTPTPAPGPALAGGAHDTSFEHEMGSPNWGYLSGGTQQNIVCGDGGAYNQSCYVQVSAAAQSDSFGQDIPWTATTGQCYTLSGWFRSPSGTFQIVLSDWVLIDGVAAQSGNSGYINIGQQWTHVTSTIRTPAPPSGHSSWTKLRGALYLESPNQLLNWDLSQWYGPYTC